MDESGDLELGLDDTATSSSSHSVRKTINIKLRASPKSKPRAKKPVRKKPKPKVIEEENIADVEGDVGQTLYNKMTGGLEPLHHNKHLNWNHKVTIIGEKVLDPLIHCCEKCCLPILLYGRMLPCKHVFCYDCAKKHKEKKCPRCLDKVTNVEQSALGTVFVCTNGGSKHSVKGCRRTYLSQRDLQAHIMYRHSTKPQDPQPHGPHGGGSGSNTPGSAHHGMEVSKDHPPPPPPPQQGLTLTQPLPHGLPPQNIPHQGAPPQHLPHDPSLYQQRPPDDLQRHALQGPPPQHHVPPPGPLPQGPPPPQPHHMHHPPPQHVQAPQPPMVTQIESYHTIPTITSRTNLITVPIQDENADYRKHAQGGYTAAGHTHPPYSGGPPPQQQYATAPHVSGPPPTYPQTPYPPPPHPMSHPGGRPAISQALPTTAGMPPHTGGPPPPVTGHAPQGQGQVMYGHYDDQHAHTPPYSAGPGGHSPRPPWPPGPRGPPPPRGPPTSSSPMGPPRGDYKQYYQ